jgi:hypothetical protein
MRVRYTNFVDVDIDANVQFQEFEYLTDQTIPDEWFSYAWDVFKDGVDWTRSGCDFNKDLDSEKWTKNYNNYVNNFPKTRTLPKHFFKYWGPLISNLQLGKRYKQIDNLPTYLHTNYAKRPKTKSQSRDNLPKGNLEELALMHSYNIKPTVDIVHWKNTYSDKSIINQLDLKVRERFNIDDSLPTTCYYTPTMPAYYSSSYPTHSIADGEKNTNSKKKHDAQLKTWNQCYIKELEYTEEDNNTRMSFDGCDWVSFEIEQYSDVHSKVYELVKDYTLFNDSDYHALMREIVTLTETCL